MAHHPNSRLYAIDARRIRSSAGAARTQGVASAPVAPRSKADSAQLRPARSAGSGPPGLRVSSGVPRTFCLP